MHILLLLLAFLPSVEPIAAFRCEEQRLAVEAELLQKIDKRYESLQSLTGVFVQRSYFVGLDEEQESRGKLEFLKPGMMRWSYQTPHEQLFISDGKNLWLYEPQDRQVTLAEFSDSFNSDLPVSFLLGVGKLDEKFSVNRVCKEEKSLIVELEPKKTDKSLRAFSLRVNEETLYPEGAKVIDIGGNETAIELRGTVLNPPLKKADFAFEIPKGVDVIDRRDVEAAAS